MYELRLNESHESSPSLVLSLSFTNLFMRLFHIQK